MTNAKIVIGAAMAMSINLRKNLTLNTLAPIFSEIPKYAMTIIGSKRSCGAAAACGPPPSVAMLRSRP